MPAAPEEEREDTFGAFMRDIRFAFDDAADYIWKAPKLLKHETREELAKLDAYFPNDLESQAFRWHFEERKLQSVFPRLMATGNLFAVVSLFEVYCLRLASIMTRQSGESLSGVSGWGLERSLTALKNAGLRPREQPLWGQVRTALMIRNCLFHANGLLNHSRDADALREVARSRVHLIASHRHPHNSDLLQIIASRFGDQAVITNEYAWIVCSYLRDYLFALSEEAARLLVSGTPGESLAP
ncbi:MAG: hypothetical protein U0270_20030 [Labilithrix sp.]